jgi:hypothetical protein
MLKILLKNNNDHWVNNFIQYRPTEQPALRCNVQPYNYNIIKKQYKKYYNYKYAKNYILHNNNINIFNIK